MEAESRNPTAPWPVAVFAYNEEELISGSLDSIRACGAGHPLAIHVLINGCTDRTEAVVRAYADRHPEVKPILITGLPRTGTTVAVASRARRSRSVSVPRPTSRRTSSSQLQRLPALRKRRAVRFSIPAMPT